MADPQVEKELPFNTNLVDGGNKPADFVANSRDVKQDDGTGTTPLIKDGDYWLTESMVVVEYLEKAYPNHGTQLLPANPQDFGRVKLFIEVFGSKFAPNMFKMFGASTTEAVEQSKAGMTKALKELNAFLTKHAKNGEPGYFLGDTYSMAETATTPFVRRGLAALPVYRGYDVMAVIEAENLTRLGQWIQASMDRPSQKETGMDDEGIVKVTKRYVKDVA